LVFAGNRTLLFQIHKAFLERFQINSKTIPTILTTSQKLSTGVDALNIRNIVLMRPINSMIEFKQIIGRGTRTFEGKDYFTVYDFVQAHKNFEDPAWDGDPGEIIIDPPGKPGDPPEPPKPPKPGDPPEDPPVRELIEIKLADDHIVNIAATTFWGPDGKPISAQDFIKRMFGELPELFKDEDELRALWSNPETRKALLARLSERGYDALILMQIKEAINVQDCDIYDVLAHIAYPCSMLKRKDRAEVGSKRVAMEYDVKLAEFLDFVLGHYIESDVQSLDRSKLPDYLKLKFGTLSEGSAALGGMDQVISSYDGFQRHLYSLSN
jgi:type I restriction enzyme R subunit